LRKSKESIDMQKKRVITGLSVTLAALAVDQLSKWWLLQLLADPDTKVNLLPFFNLVMVWNRGISFGMFSEHFSPYIFIAVAVGIVGILLRWLWTAHFLSTAVALGLVMGGAIGNVIDRLRFGAVADFFDFYIENYHWPAFNVADSCIFIGVVILLLESMFRGSQPS
jgi:signal peptidase II